MDESHHAIDAGAAAIAVASFIGWLPAIAGLLAIIWYGMSIVRMVELRYQAHKIRKQMAACTNMECRCVTYCARVTERNWR